MSVLSAIGNIFKKFGKLILSALTAAQNNGLSDQIVALALQWVKIAATKELDNAQKREFVVQLLVNKGVKESLARLAVELSVQLMKSEVDKIPDAG